MTAESADTVPVLSVKGLRVEIPLWDDIVVPVNDVSFDIAPGEVLGIVGESGAGKSITGAAVIGPMDPPSRIAGGEVWLQGRRIDTLSGSELRRIRGRDIGAVFQDPLTALDPLQTVGEQLIETIRTHLPLDRHAARTRAIAMLDQVGLPAAERRLDDYPHHLSGGMRQRVVIAMALCTDPVLVIADEPTTALDVSIQAQIIDLLKTQCRQRGTAVMLITHDMGVIAETADRVGVMYAGRLVEIGSVTQMIKAPRHPYTHGLMASIPRLNQIRRRLTQIKGAMPRLTAIPDGCAFHPRCSHAVDKCRETLPVLTPLDDGGAAACWQVGRSGNRPALPQPSVVPDLAPLSRLVASEPPLVDIDNVSQYFDVSKPLIERLATRQGRRILKAVDGVSLSIRRGETVAIVGESGCGKSTLARMVVGLYRPTSGSVRFDGTDVGKMRRQHRFQMIFQDPYASLNPRWRTASIIAEPIRTHGIDVGRGVRRRVDELLEMVGLSAADGDRYPHEFSGGQRQRISIARALACEPEFIVCDEPTSALDVSVQAQILNLMKDLQDELKLTLMFISHNLAVVRHMADHIGVMYLGRLVETSPASELFARPKHPYTRMLLDAIPDIERGGRVGAAPRGEAADPANAPTGCGFHPRCAIAVAACRIERPNLVAQGDGAAVACPVSDTSAAAPADASHPVELVAVR